MWQAPNQRVRAIASQRKRDRDRNRRPLHIKRVRAEIKVVGDAKGSITEGRVVLNDISPHGLGLFTTNPLAQGQQIALTIENPKRFYVKGRIVWCQEHDADSHVLSEMPFSYRVGIEFHFESETEEQQIRAYCEELARDHLYGDQAA